MKKVQVLMVAVAMLAAFAGCADAKQEKKPEPAKTEKPVEYTTEQLNGYMGMLQIRAQALEDSRKQIEGLIRRNDVDLNKVNDLLKEKAMLPAKPAEEKK